MKIEELPIFKMPTEELSYFQSFNGMVEKIKKTGHMVFSFSLRNNMLFDAAHEIDVFKKHFSCIGEISESSSCLPNTIRLNLKISNDVWDAMEIFKIKDLKSILMHCSSDKMHVYNDAKDDNNVFLCMSQKFKTITLFYETDDRQWLTIDQDTAVNKSFSVFSFGIYSFGHMIQEYFTGYWNKSKQWFPKSWSKKKKESFTWLDRNRSPLTNTEFYSTLTFSYYGNFSIDLPIASSYDDIALIQPLFELKLLKNNLQKAQENFCKASKYLEDAQNSVEKMLIEYELKRR